MTVGVARRARAVGRRRAGNACVGMWPLSIDRNIGSPAADLWPAVKIKSMARNVHCMDAVFI